MRGIFLHQSIEFRLEVTGESFSQGSAVPYSLLIKNHSESSLALHELSIVLALGDLKKVKLKDPSAFQPVLRAEIERGCELAPHGQLTFPNSFSLDRNSPITDKHQSLYILYGNSSDLGSLGQLLLTVSPHPYIRTIFDTMTTTLNFISKGESYKDGAATAKLKAPDSRRLSLVNELNLSARFVEDSLELRFVFTVKKFDTSSTKINVKQGKVEVVKLLSPSEYLFGGNFVRQECIEETIESALEAVSTGL